jgi:hypothetical protein
MRTQSAATRLLDHIDRWQKLYADDIATIHLRKPGAVHTVGAGGRFRREVAIAIQKYDRRSNDKLLSQEC